MIFQQFDSTNSPEAYRYFIYGNKCFYEKDYSTAMKLLFQAIAIDSNFTIATIYTFLCIWKSGMYEEARKWCLKVYKKRDQLPMQQKIMANEIYALYFETPYEEIKYLKQLLEFDDQASNYLLSI